MSADLPPEIMAALAQGAAPQDAPQTPAPVDPTESLIQVIDTCAKMGMTSASTNPSGTEQLGRAAQLFAQALATLNPPAQPAPGPGQ